MLVRMLREKVKMRWYRRVEKFVQLNKRLIQSSQIDTMATSPPFPIYSPQLMSLPPLPLSPIGNKNERKKKHTFLLTHLIIIKVHTVRKLTITLPSTRLL